MKRIAKVIFYYNDKFLIQLRDNSEIAYPNTWTLLGGGIENKESALDALKRELIEELNFSDFKPQFLFKKVRITDGKEVEDNIFCAEVGEDILENELKEGQKIQFFTIDEIKELNVFEPFREYVIEFANAN
ncbi:MAG: NUDIX domain-containing protein [Candidatus Diapherotrites archaeon]|jgi:8-oxo-dGTP diphosphatase|uniref:NUDIX domain-containing protein n=1 Tax=Candidatus Iainarchaeum sp. TaxID=3101447 RepID=A0A8T5GFN1_9ARCH|nr:NUDIX domain-containing protein [Candidatus Diapherotrites archaeon]